MEGVWGWVPLPLKKNPSLREFMNGNARLAWRQLLELHLVEVRRPNIKTHHKLGAMEWQQTSELCTSEGYFIFLGWYH